jgi:sulfatase maturation enzyme AslB (radical SAM superfamily)
MNKIITVKDYTKNLKLGRPELDGQAMCANKWTFLSVHFDAGIIKNCCNVPAKPISSDDLLKYDTDVFFNTPYELERRQEKLDNVKHSDCVSCWTCEEKGVRSQRKPEPFYEAHRSRFNVPRGTEALPTFLELYFNNTCDLKCVYCNDLSSSQWATELKKYNELSLNYKDTTDGKLKEIFYQWFETEGCQNILNYSILGGEPLIQSEFHEFVEYLLVLMEKNPNRHKIKPELTVFTNGNTPTKYMDRWLLLLDRLHNHVSVRIEFSNESIGARSEFIRSNLNWNTFESNVNRTIIATKGKDIRIRFACTHNVLSIARFIDFLKWVNDLQITHGIEIEFGSNGVVQPSYLSTWNLTEDYKSSITEAIDWINQTVPSWKEYSEYLSTIRDGLGKYNIDDLISIPAFVERMKERRGLDFATTFPELQNWYKFCNEVAVKGK